MDTTDDFLEHYGVKGMRWGRRSLSTRQKRIAAPKRKGAIVGAATGATLAVASAYLGSKALRSRTLNKLMVDIAVNKGVKKLGDDPLIRGLLEVFVSQNVLKENFRAAEIFSNPKFMASAAVGSAFVASTLGGSIAVNRSEKKYREENVN